MPLRPSYLLISILTTASLIAFFGVVTALIPNPWFVRMVKVTTLDYFFLTSSSLLIGAYAGIHIYKKRVGKGCKLTAYSGGMGSFLSFGCPVCNKLLTLLFGASALMIYFEPYRPLLGFASIATLAAALYWKVRK